MQIFSLKNPKKALQEAIKVLRNDGIVAHPTDTCYGFAASIFSKKAIEKLYKLKKMSRHKPVSILVASVQEAKQYGFWNKKAEILAQKFWPGQLTIVVKRKKSLPRWLNLWSKTIGVRLPRHVFSRALVKKLGHPVTTTSANITGKASPYSLVEIRKQFKNQTVKPDLIFDGGSLDPKNLPSSVVDASKKKSKILRIGSLNALI